MFRRSAATLGICAAVMASWLTPASASTSAGDAVTGGQVAARGHGTVEAYGYTGCHFSWKEPWIPTGIRFETDLGEVVNARISGNSYTATFRYVPIPPTTGPGGVQGVYADALIDCGGGYKPAVGKRFWIGPATEDGPRKWKMDVTGWGS